MVRKKKFMFKGAIVKALGKKAVITKIDENSFDGNDWVYRIFCKKEGEKHSKPYHPSDVEELVIT